MSGGQRALEFTCEIVPGLLRKTAGFQESKELVVHQFSLVSLCNPMDCSAPGLPVHHQLLEFTQIHVH